MRSLMAQESQYSQTCSRTSSISTGRVKITRDIFLHITVSYTKKHTETTTTEAACTATISEVVTNGCLLPQAVGVWTI